MIDVGLVTCYAAATDSAIVPDVSGSVPILPILYGKAGGSVVIDFKNDNANFYSHLGVGEGSSCDLSASVGVVGNYEKPDDYKGPFVGGNAGYWLGIDHCWDPRKEHGTATQATSITLSSGFSGGAEFSWFSSPFQIFEWR